MTTKLYLLQNCQTRKDLAELLNVDYQHLCYILYSQPIHVHYKEGSIPKKGGGQRQILAPQGSLKNIQQKLSIILSEIYSEINSNLLPLCYSYRKDNEKKFGFYENAKIHTNAKLIINIDLENFFRNISFSRIVGFFHKNKNINLNYDVAIIIAQISCYKDPLSSLMYLPQGSPTSPIISNFIGSILDNRLFKTAKKYKLIYSRYSDDLTFSSTTNNISQDICKKDDNNNWILGEKLIKEINRCDFKINYKKINIRDQYNRQQVTGLTVNKKAIAKYKI